MRRWIRTLAVYAPGIALLIAGTVVTVLFPVLQHSGACSCPNGEACSCPSFVETLNPLGPGLLFSGGIYSLIVFVVRNAKHAKRVVPPWGRERA